MSAFEPTPRKGMTKLQRARFFTERGGHCEECGIKLRPGSKWEIGNWQRDHTLALAHGGTDCDATNTRLLCVPCHGSKTKSDQKQTAKIRRVAAQNIVPHAHRQKSALSKREGYKFNWSKRRYEKTDA